MKIYAILKSTTDYTGCYYESDLPSKSVAIVDFAITQEEAKQKVIKYELQELKEEVDKGPFYGRIINFQIHEITKMPKPLIKYLWDNRDNQ